MRSITVVGDYDASNPTHTCLDEAIAHARAAIDVDVAVRWVATDEVEPVPTVLGGSDGVFIAPASPYRSFEGAIAAIEWARTSDVPLLGTCAGFQHVVIEFARNVAGLDNADHAEYGRAGTLMVIDELACSLAGQTMDIQLVEGSTAHRAYGTATATERYYCRFGLNQTYAPALVELGLRIAGTDVAGEPRIVELAGKRFFLATLFVPQVRSSAEHPHPLIEAFVSACVGAEIATA